MMNWSLKIKLEIMLDSGAMGMGYIDRNLVAKLGLEFLRTDRVIRVTAIDGTACGTGLIEFCVHGRVSFDGFSEDLELLVHVIK